MCDFFTDQALNGEANELRILAGFVVDVEVEEFSGLLTSTVYTSPELDNAQIVLPPLASLTTWLTEWSYLVAIKLSRIKLELASSGNEIFE